MTPTEKNEGYRTADEMAERQREISVSEFFLKNRHLLGFDSGAKALVTTVKEAEDYALDACEREKSGTDHGFSGSKSVKHDLPDMHA